jgi:hypothetical protein
MNVLSGLFEIRSLTGMLPLLFVGILLLILVISFRSRATVFCQYLEVTTGIRLNPAEVRKVLREKGRGGVRDLFLDLIIREDLKAGPLQIPPHARARDDKETT